MAFVCIFHGVGHEVRNHLLDTLFVKNCHQGGVGVLLDKGDVGILNTLGQ